MADEQATDKALRELFENRISPDLLEKLLSDPSILDVNGEERVLTVLFADAKNVTRKQNSMEMREFFKYMNKHFAVLSEVIVSNGGFLDKIIGDEFMAIWGTPVNVYY